MREKPVKACHADVIDALDFIAEKLSRNSCFLSDGKIRCAACGNYDSALGRRLGNNACDAYPCNIVILNGSRKF